MDIKRNGTSPSAPGPADYFTGKVRLDTPFKAEAPGQTVIVTSGLGWAQREGGPIEEIRPGDVVWFPPGEKHWHGATDKTAMTHVAIAEAQDGSPVTWLEQVSDAQYLGKA